MPRLFILCGEAFSGKSTLSKIIAVKYGATIMGRDEIWFATENLLSLSTLPEADDHHLWEALWPVMLQGVKNHLLAEHSVVVDDTCFLKKQRDELRAVAESVHVPSLLIYLDAPAELLDERRRKNKETGERHDVPSAVLKDDKGVFERPGGDETHLVYNEAVPFEELVARIDGKA